MLIEDEFKAIYLNYKIKEIILFLEKLTPKEKEKIIVILKNYLKKDWGHNTISMLAALVCSKNKSEYETIAASYFSFPVNLIEQLFETDVPEWIGESYSFLHNIEYLTILGWQEKGWLTMNPEVCASILAESIGSRHTTEELLFTKTITLDAYIWLLFEYESGITGHYNNGRTWKTIFESLVLNHTLDRSKVLKSCLNAGNQNFSKDHNTWFFELFLHLNPTIPEILAVQDALFSIFYSGQTTLFLPLLKTISPAVADDDFKKDDFLRAVDPLVMLTAKNVLNGLLQIIEKLLKKDTKDAENICLMLLPIFLNKEPGLQTKAAKILVKYGSPASTKIREELKIYSASLLSDSRNLLGNYLSNNEDPESVPHIGTEHTAWHLSEKIPHIVTVSDFIFFAGKVFSTHEPAHFHLFVDALLRLNNQIEDEHFKQLDPVFKTILKWKDTAGFNHLLAAFFIQYSLIQQKNPTSILLEAQSKFPALEKWVDSRTPLVFKAYHELLMGVLEFLKEGKDLPLLSVPTHTPCWIEGKLLVDQVKIYQEKKEKPVPFDIQMAVLKVKKENSIETGKYAEKHLDKEYVKYFEPLFIPDFYKDQYDSRYLNGNFDWKYGIKKIHKWNAVEEVPEITVTISNQSRIQEDAGVLDYVFNSSHGIYYDDLIQILYTTPYFSGSFFAKKYNETLSNAAYQYDGKGNAALLDAWMKLELPFQKIHYLFLSAGLFSKDKTFSGTAFEALINRAVAADFDLSVLGLLIGEKVSFGPAQVKKITDGLSGYINLSPEHNQAFEKLIISILTAIKNPVFNLKKLLELYYELMKLNHSAPNKALIEKLKEWEKENNLKKIIHQIKD